MIDSKTQLYAVFGNPVTHSKRPFIHNAWFDQNNVNAAYLAFEIDHISKGVAAIKTLHIQGASITLPFKESIIKHLDHIDDNAAAIGAVNTVVNRAGKLFGYNTDHEAAIAPLKVFGIKGKRVCIIGAGGAAQALAYGIHREKGCLTIVNRNKQRGETLAKKYGATFIPMDDISNRHGADILINTTSVGMSPNIGKTAFPSRRLTPHMIVMDIVYTPLKTKLLTDAENKGCTIIDGMSMFLHQGAAQFRLWTGITPDIPLMRHTIMNGGN